MLDTMKERLEKSITEGIKDVEARPDLIAGQANIPHIPGSPSPKSGGDVEKKKMAGVITKIQEKKNLVGPMKTTSQEPWSETLAHVVCENAMCVNWKDNKCMAATIQIGSNGKCLTFASV